MMMTVQIDYQSLKDPGRAMGRSASDEWSDPDELASSSGSESFDLKIPLSPGLERGVCFGGSAGVIKDPLQIINGCLQR